jgi:FtsH-binding integral membrane protein
MPFILWLFFIRKINTIELKVFFVYTFLFSCLILLNIYFKYITKDLNLQLLVKRISLLIEFWALSIFYYQTLKNKFRGPFLLVSNLIFIAAFVLDFFKSSPGEFSYIPLVIESIFFLFLIVYDFYEKLNFHIIYMKYNKQPFGTIKIINLK